MKFILLFLSISVDYGIMEKADNVVVIDGEFGGMMLAVGIL